MCSCSVNFFGLMWLIVIMFFFFFKQKTAYDMRISDWSSDVCSSDLGGSRRRRMPGDIHPWGHPARLERPSEATRRGASAAPTMRSEERRVGKACDSTCRSRWSQYHLNKNNRRRTYVEETKQKTREKHNIEQKESLMHVIMFSH